MGNKRSEKEKTPEEPSGIEGFDLDQLRLPQNFADWMGVKKTQLHVPMRKPRRQEFIRCHPDSAWTFQASMLKLQGDRRDDLYLVSPTIATSMNGDVVPVLFVGTTNRQNAFFLWPLRIPDLSGRQDDYARTAMAAAQVARTRWIKVVANQSISAYEIHEPLGELSDPVWPDESFTVLCQRAMKDRAIMSSDHPVLRELRGEV